MTARDEILAAVEGLPNETFTIMEVLREMEGTSYSERTIRTHITSRMCAAAPDHHGTTYDDLERLGQGCYRLRR